MHKKFFKPFSPIIKPIAKIFYGGGQSWSSQAQAAAAELAYQQKLAAEKAAAEAAAKAKAEAEEKARLEQERLDNIAAGRTAIEDAFQPFGDPYFQGIQDDFASFQMDDLNRKYGQSLGSLISDLARTGQLNAATRNRGVDSLKSQYDTAKGNIDAAAIQFANDERARVESGKDALFAGNETDFANSAEKAQSAAAQFLAERPTEFSTLANLIVNPNSIANVSGTKAAAGGSAAPALFNQERSARGGGFTVG